MRLAVIADIHGILPALDAFFKDIANEQIDGIIVAGDMIAGPQSNEVIKRLQRYRILTIRGNQENYILNLASGKASEWQYSCKQWNFIRWTYENIDDAVLQFIRSLPEQYSLQLPGKDAIRIVHGSPASVTELIYPEADISRFDQVLGLVPEECIVFGHTHEAWIKERNGKLALNPGSLSMSFQGEQYGTYAILEWTKQRWTGTLRKLHYDFRLVRKTYIETGLLAKGDVFARCCLVSIETGINYLSPMLVDAYQQSKEAGYGDSPFVPDEIWDEVAQAFEQRNYGDLANELIAITNNHRD
jgi:putative phosphoesterase